MKSIMRNAFVGLCATALFFALSNPAQAQITAGSGELAVNGGFNNAGSFKSDGTVSNYASSFGGSAGYNMSQNLAVLGEYQYIPEGSISGVTFKTQLYGASLRYSYTADKLAPYFLVGGGGSRGSAGTSGLSASVNGAYVSFGGGVSAYLGKNWGVRPEFRYDDVFFSGGGSTSSATMWQVTGGIFFQFGGQSTTKKKASSGN